MGNFPQEQGSLWNPGVKVRGVAGAVGGEVPGVLAAFLYPSTG